MLRYLLIFISSLLLTACGGGDKNGTDPDPVVIDSISINMSPLRLVGFGDDRIVSIFNAKHPLVKLGSESAIASGSGTIVAGQNWLLRIRDPYGEGDFYSTWVSNGWGVPAPGTPAVDDGEPDNDTDAAFPLLFDSYVDRGFNPLFDEDWFSYVVADDTYFLFASTTSNGSGNQADPVLEVYDPLPNVGAVTYTEGVVEINALGTGDKVSTAILGTFDPANNSTLIALNIIDGNSVDINAFSLIFTGTSEPGNYLIQYAFPPIPPDIPGSVTGTVNISKFGDVGGRIIGDYDLTIIDTSRTTTVSGSFNVKREADESGLLDGYKPAAAKLSFVPARDTVKKVSAFIRRTTSN